MAATTTSPSQPMITPSKCDEDDQDHDRMKRKSAVGRIEGGNEGGEKQRDRDEAGKGRLKRQRHPRTIGHSPEARSPHTTHSSTPPMLPVEAARCAKLGGDLRLPAGEALVSAEATRLMGEVTVKSVGEGLVEARLRAPLQSILMGGDPFLRGGDFLPAFPLNVGVMEMMGGLREVAERSSCLQLAETAFFLELVRMAAAAALTAAAFEESCSSFNLACHSRA